MALAAVLAAGCGSSSGNRIRLGAVLSGTGDLANTGSTQLDAAVLAAEEVNGYGGVLGSKLSIVWRDDRSDPGTARTAAQSLLSEGVVAVIGAAGSDETLAASEVLAPSKTLLVSASATATNIETAKNRGYLFRTCASDAMQGRLLASRAAKRGLAEVAIVHVPGSFGEAFSEEFDAAFNATGGSISSTWEYTPGQPDYTPLLTQLFQWGKPEAILLVGYPVDSAQLVTDYLAGFAARGSVFFFPSTLEDTAFVTAVGPSNFTFEHEGTGPGQPSGDAYQTFADDFRRRYGRDPGAYAANAYDAVYLLALAIETAGNTDPAAIADALPSVSMGIGAKYGPAGYRDAVTTIHAGKHVNYEGASGPVDFDDEGDVMAPFDIWQVVGGAITVTEHSAVP